MSSGKFKGGRSESVLFISNVLKKNKNWLLYGAGDTQDINPESIISLSQELAAYLYALKIKNFILVPSQHLINHLSGIKSGLKGFVFEVYAP